MTKKVYLPNTDRIWKGIEFILLANIFIWSAFDSLFPDTIIWLTTSTLKTLLAFMVILQIIASIAFYLRMPKEEDSKQSANFKKAVAWHFSLLFVTSAAYYLTYHISFGFKIVVFLTTVMYVSLGVAIPIVYLFKVMIWEKIEKYFQKFLLKIFC